MSYKLWSFILRSHETYHIHEKSCLTYIDFVTLTKVGRSKNGCLRFFIEIPFIPILLNNCKSHGIVKIIHMRPIFVYKEKEFIKVYVKFEL
jgi:hypothetical protein